MNGLTIMIDNPPAPEHESRYKFLSKRLKGGGGQEVELSMVA